MELEEKAYQITLCLEGFIPPSAVMQYVFPVMYGLRLGMNI